MRFAETPSDNSRFERSVCRRSPLIEAWADEAIMLIVDVFAHKAAVQAIEEKYFEGHQILFRDVDRSLTQAIKTIEDAVATFNEYLKSRADLFSQEWAREEREGEEDGKASLMSSIPGEREGHLVLSIEAIQYRVKDHFVDHITDEWVKNAKHKAVADILQETQEHEVYVWQSFRERVEEKG